MKALLFDLDDTIYDQFVPFYQAFTKTFSYDDISIEELFITSRKLSEEAFLLFENGKIERREMFIYRMKKALLQFNKSCTDEEALFFQNEYKIFSDKIYLLPDMQKLLSYCQKKHIILGIITNGFSNNQRKKIEVLNLQRWIPETHIFISSEVGVSKPNSRIFQIVEEKLCLKKEEKYFVGDSFTSDIIGAKKAGWKAVWFNRRNIRQPDNLIKPDYVVSSEEKLLNFVKLLV